MPPAQPPASLDERPSKTSQVLAFSSWIALAAGLISVLGGFHPSDAQRDTRLTLTLAVVLALNAPLALRLGPLFAKGRRRLAIRFALGIALRLGATLGLTTFAHGISHERRPPSVPLGNSATVSSPLVILDAGVARPTDGGPSAAFSTDAEIEIRGIEGSAVHVHGGAPAKLGSASFSVVSRSARARRLTVTQIDYLVGTRDCVHAPREVKSHPAFSSLHRQGSVDTKSPRTLTLAANSRQTVEVYFEPVSAYYVHCDRFAFRVHFSVDGKSLVSIAETAVTRMEPPRDRSKAL